MPTRPTPTRPPLSKHLILQAAVELADREGLEALTMRRLGAELGFEAMSLYKHVANKDEILDGINDLVIAEVEIPNPGAEWSEAMRRRASSAREVLTRHSWAIGLFEARGWRGPAVLQYLDAILGNLRSAGFSIEDAAHAFWMLDTYVYGHVVQETSTRTSGPDAMAASEGSSVDQRPTEEYPHLAEMEEHARTADFSFDKEFQFGLDLVLAGLASLAAGSSGES